MTDVGRMMLVGAMVALPAAIVGLVFSIIVDKRMPIEMRPMGTSDKSHEALAADKLPSFWVSILPVVLPVLLIGAGTLATTIADGEDRAKFVQSDIQNFTTLPTRC